MSALTVAEVLERAADLIEPEGAWARGIMYAVKADGSPSNPWDPAASCFCMVGAIARAWDKRPAAVEQLLRDAPEYTGILDVGKRTLSGWNDDYIRTQPEVVAKLREAAALAREQGK